MEVSNRLSTAKFISLTLALLLTAGAAFGDWSLNERKGGFNAVNIYTPETVSPIGNGRSLLIILHGCTHPISDFISTGSQTGAQLEDPSEEYGMVVAVPDAANKEGFSCWGYWTSQNRNVGDYANLIDLVDEMTGDSNYNIDPNQVYVAGLSSGASFANTIACLAPDVFAGVGVSAGPTIGTSANDAIGGYGNVPPSTFKARCEGYAGSNRSFLQTQVASIGHGDADTLVSTQYNRQNAEGMAAVYGVSELSTTRVIEETPGHTAQEFMWEDGRVSMLWFNGLPHDWSGGQGANGGSYIDSQSINYARYLGEFFSTYNNRVDRNQGPVLSNVQFSSSNTNISVSGSASDAEGSVSQVVLTVEGLTTGATDTASTGSSNFSLSTGNLPEDLYLVEVVGIDNEGAEGDTVTDTQTVGNISGARAPILRDVAVSTNQRCATVSGLVVDLNEDVSSVTVAFSTETVTATIDGFDFEAEACFLPGGSNTATVTATDATGLSTTAELSFDIDAGVTATVTEHINAGRLDYANGYSACYLAFSSDPFTMFERPFGNGCRWEEAGGACAGPEVTCSGPPINTPTPTPTPVVTPTPTPVVTPTPTPTPVVTPTPTPTPGPECTNVTAMNYYHKIGGRAYSTGSYWTPNYYANGSNQAMAGSTYGTTTLRSTNGTYWEVGTCP